jgi:hypothetical protein
MGCCRLDRLRMYIILLGLEKFGYRLGCKDWNATCVCVVVYGLL